MTAFLYDMTRMQITFHTHFGLIRSYVFNLIYLASVYDPWLSSGHPDIASNLTYLRETTDSISNIEPYPLPLERVNPLLSS